jgi:putative thioredoxin
MLGQSRRDWNLREDGPTHYNGLTMTTDYELKTDFSEEVLEASAQIPILVDFWAEWCGPCRVLGPILEKLAGEADGRWKLVKVNTEVHPDLAQAFDIRGIPAVKLFSQGEAIAEFAGALPEAQVKNWLDENLPGESDTEFAAALQAFEADDLEAARSHLQRALAQDATDHRARLLLARILFLDDPESAGNLASEIPEDDEAAATAAQIVTLAAFVGWGSGDASSQGDGASEDSVTRYRHAAKDLASGNLEGALETLISLAGKDRKLDEDGARRMAVALFAVLGEAHSLTRRFRSKLASVLY